MMKNSRKWLQSNHGFTLAETLMTVLILLMVASVLATGVPAAARTMNKIVETAHAQVLLSTTITVLRDELTTAKANSIAIDEEKKITYIDCNGIKSVIFVKNDGIYIKKPSTSETETLLISKEAANKNLFSTYTSFDYANRIVTINGISVKKAETTLSGDPITLKIKVLG